MNMALLKQISMINVFILLITCNADSTIPNSNFSSDHASIKRLVEPLSYNLMINLALANFLVFNGTSSNLIIIENPTKKIDLNVHGLTITNMSLCVCRYPYMDRFYSNKNPFYSNETGRLTFNFDSHVPSGFYNITIKFFRDIFENEIQVYRTCEGCGQARFIFTPQLERAGTRQIFPSWNGNTSRTRLSISVRHYQNCVALSNMPIQKQWTVHEFITETKFYTTPLIPIYLATFSVTDFVCFTKEKHFTIRMCSTSLVKNQATFALNTSADVVSYMRGYVKMSPRFPEITIIGLPDSFYENAENWGFNIYSEDYLTYNETLHTIEQKLDVSLIVASITAFQWFNHLVSPVLWTHVWLCQTLALFFGAKAFAETYYDDDMSSLFTYQLRSLARENDIIRTVKPTLYANYSEDVDKLNTYNKKYIFLTSHFTNCLKEYALIVMLENIITEPIFRMAIISYLKKHQFSTATPNDFWDALQHLADQSVTLLYFPIAKVMQNWLIQSSLPVVKVTLTKNTELFLSKSENDNNTNELLVPIKYVIMSRSRNVSGVVLLEREKKKQISLSGITPFDAIIVNWQYAGYYRVIYDVLSFKKLASYLVSKDHKNIDVLSRAHIIEDAYYFWSTKEINIDMFLNVTSFMFIEEECAPWLALQNIIQEMWNFFNNKVGEPIKKFVQHLLQRLLQKIGYTEHPSDTDCVKFKRYLGMKWACRLHNLKCLSLAKKKLEEHLREPEKHIISPLWEEWTYCSGLKFSNEFIWSKVWTKFMKTGNKKILTYLICSENYFIIRDYLDLLMSKKPSILDLFGLNSKDREKIYRSIVQKHVWKDEVMQYVFKKIVETKTNDMSFVKRLSYVIRNLYSTDKLEKISSFLLEYYNTGVYNTRIYSSLLRQLQNQIFRILEVERRSSN